MMRTLIALSIAALLTAATGAQELRTTESAPVPNGSFKDSYGTTLQISPCGDGTELCGVLLDVQGESRTEENLIYLNKQIMQAEQTGPDKWEGTVVYQGSKAKATITRVSADTIEIQGCQILILCETIAFTRV
jgi:uncharacterized protein (DUF2147 family)